MKYVVQVVSYETGEIVKETPCDNERAAARLERGLNINLDHERFYTRIEQAKATNF